MRETDSLDHAAREVLCYEAPLEDAAGYFGVDSLSLKDLCLRIECFIAGVRPIITGPGTIQLGEAGIEMPVETRLL